MRRRRTTGEPRIIPKTQHRSIWYLIDWLPLDPVGAPADGYDRRLVLHRDLEHVAEDVILQVSSIVSRWDWEIVRGSSINLRFGRRRKRGKPFSISIGFDSPSACIYSTGRGEGGGREREEEDALTVGMDLPWIWRWRRAAWARAIIMNCR